MNYIKDYLVNKKTLTEDVNGSCVAVEYDNNGEEVRIVWIASNLVGIGSLYSNTYLYQKKNLDGNWTTRDEQKFSATEQEYLNDQGNPVSKQEAFERVDDLNNPQLTKLGEPILDGEGNPTYHGKSQLKSGYTTEATALEQSTGKSVLYPLFLQMIRNRFDS